ncbi:MAG: hypothetical protein WBP58_08900 [Chitinophagaceae bacterium]
MVRLFFILLILVSCFSKPRQIDVKKIESTTASSLRFEWTKLLDSAAWRKNYNFQMFTIRDTMWTFHPDGTWFSLDGSTWAKGPLPNIINNMAFLDYVLRNDTLYGFGYFKGNIETYSYKPNIYRSTDMRHWATISTASNLPPRFFYHPFVFRGKFWLIGGEDRQRKYNDIWRSDDGIQWTQVKSNLPFGERSGSQVVQKNDSLFLLDNDVWCSTDALNWTKLTDEIVNDQPIFGYNAIVMNNTIFLLGCNRNGQFTSQVLFSQNGREWLGMDAPWSARGGVAATVYQNKIYMTGGKYGGTPQMPDFHYSNDVWMLSTER